MILNPKKWKIKGDVIAYLYDVVLAVQVDPGLGRPGRTRTRPNFFFQMWDLKPISIYTLYFQEKSHVFSMWDKKTFWFKYFNLKG